jgi:glycosyltransferase involved in cell wall biosynthesis
MSSWISCQKIVFNLHKAYQLNEQFELLNFNYSSSLNAEEISELAKAIVARKPDIIVILDHKPHPLPLLQNVVQSLGGLTPRFVFHVFGDFSLYYAQWNKLNKILQGFEVDFIVASDRQKKFLDQFLTAPLEAKVCPFPVDAQEFNYAPHLRNEQRKSWGLKENDVAFVFSGRVSRQKRIHTLLRSFAEMIIKTNTDRAHLFIYGNADHIGDQFIGIWETEGEYFRKINRLYRSFPEHIQERIHFMGGVPNDELRAVYQGADYLVNPSVHNDEDYGMSVAEALCSGLPVILTDWGGLAGFRIDEVKGATTFIPVKIGKEAKIVHAGKLREALEINLQLDLSLERKKISQIAQLRFGIEASSRKVIETIKTKGEPLLPFTPLFERVMAKSIMSVSPYITSKKTINSLYRKIYSAYVRDH